MRDGRFSTFNGHGSVVSTGFRSFNIPDGVRISCATIDDQQLLQESFKVQPVRNTVMRRIMEVRTILDRNSNIGISDFRISRNCQSRSLVER